MPSFLKDLSLRRRSKASFNTASTATNGASDQNSSSSNDGNDEQRSQHTSNGNKSSSTLSSWFDKQSPPATLGKSHSSSHLPSMNGNGVKTPPLPGGRPGMPGPNNRYSLVVSKNVA